MIDRPADREGLAGVLIAGGSSGIGLALMRSLAERGVPVCNLDAAPPEQQAAGCATYPVDLRDPGAVVDAVERIEREGAPISAVAAIAGVGYNTAFDALGPDEFAQQVVANLHLVFHLVKAVVGRLAVSSIVTVASGSIYGHPGASVAYVAAKAGVVGLTRSLALELAPRRIRVNCVVPGPVDTGLFRRLSTTSERRLLTELTPLRRLAEPDAVADGIAFLLGERARHVTGQTLVVDGGLSLAYRPVM